MMDFAAPPTKGRRPGLGSALVIAGFVLLTKAPYLVLGPLALLLLLSRPTSAREWFWIALSLAVSVYAFRGDGDLVERTVRAMGVVAGGTFVGLSIWLRKAVFTRAGLAVLVATAAIVIWGLSLGLTLSGFEKAVQDQLAGSYQELLAGQPTGEASNDVRDFLQWGIDTAPQVARVFAAIIVLETVAGLILAWIWYHRIAQRPLGDPAGRFRDFRFNDHLVWGAIITLGLVLFPLPEPAAHAVLDLLVIWMVLYAARGLAVLATLAALWPGPLKVLALLVAVPLAPFVLATLVMIGLADTWMDIRARIASALTGGTKP
ncbi:MAG: DUF2232 domain-containing protein [Gemmatimonadota bacterium]